MPLATSSISVCSELVAKLNKAVFTALSCVTSISGITADKISVIFKLLSSLISNALVAITFSRTVVMNSAVSISTVSLVSS